jgi:hypothetical protein
MFHWHVKVSLEFDIHKLCLGPMQPWQLMAKQEEALKVAWLNQVVLCILGLEFCVCTFSIVLCNRLGLHILHSLSFCFSESEYLICGTVFGIAGGTYNPDSVACCNSLCCTTATKGVCCHCLLPPLYCWSQ